jgi:hypothetical protein
LQIAVLLSSRAGANARNAARRIAGTFDAQP